MVGNPPPLLAFHDTMFPGYGYGSQSASTTAWPYGNASTVVMLPRSLARNYVDEFLDAVRNPKPGATYCYPDSELSYGVPQWDEQALLTLLPFRRRFARPRDESSTWRNVARLSRRFRARDVDHTRRRRDKR